MARMMRKGDWAKAEQFMRRIGPSKGVGPEATPELHN